MPRMSKKRKQEWALFLNHRNRITYNELCRKCQHDCKISLRGLRQDATMFDEIIIDVNTMYFEKNGGYEYFSVIGQREGC